MKNDYDLAKIGRNLLVIGSRLQNLLPFVLATVMMVLVAHSEVQTAHSFFQSPVQPTNTPIPVPPVDTPTPEANTPVEPIENSPSEPPAATQPQEQPAPLTPIEPAIVIDSPEVSGVSSGVSIEEAPKAVINPVALIDIIVQWIASLWLCVGVGFILLIPLVFLFLQVRGARLRR